MTEKADVSWAATSAPKWICEAKVFCTKCGSYRNPGANFCEHCGFRFPLERPDTASDFSVPKSPAPATISGMSPVFPAAPLLSHQKILLSYTNVRIEMTFDPASHYEPQPPLTYEVPKMLVTRRSIIFLDRNNQLFANKMLLRNLPELACATTFRPVYLSPFWVLDPSLNEELDQEFRTSPGAYSKSLWRVDSGEMTCIGWVLEQSLGEELPEGFNKYTVVSSQTQQWNEYREWTGVLPLGVLDENLRKSCPYSLNIPLFRATANRGAPPESCRAENVDHVDSGMGQAATPNTSRLQAQPSENNRHEDASDGEYKQAAY